jgi:hypothetical protein
MQLLQSPTPGPATTALLLLLLLQLGTHDAAILLSNAHLHLLPHDKGSGTLQTLASQSIISLSPSQKVSSSQYKHVVFRNEP